MPAHAKKNLAINIITFGGRRGGLFIIGPSEARRASKGEYSDCSLKQTLPLLITFLQGTPQAYHQAQGIVRTDRELHKLLTTMALRYKDREGGYTRVIKAGFRQPDAAPIAYIE